jgi:soluble cytochrome b562
MRESDWSSDVCSSDLAIQDIYSDAHQKAKYQYFDSKGLPVTLALDKDYQEKFRSLKGQISDKRFYAAVTDMKGKSRDIEKVFAAEQRGKVPDKFFETFNISAETVNKARELKQAGITAEQYLTAIEKANTNGSSNVSKAEAMEYLDSTSLDRYKKYVLMKALVPNLKDKNNPYY